MAGTSDENQLTFEELKQLHGANHVIDDNALVEVKIIFDKLDGAIIKELDDMSKRITKSELKDYIDDLSDVNRKIRSLHTSEYVSEGSQEPVQLSINELTAGEVVQLDQDIEDMRKKSNTGRGTGNKDNWISGCEKDLELLKSTGYFDMSKGNPQSLANYCLEAGRELELNQALEDSLILTDEDKARFVTEKREGLAAANHFQVDPLFLLALFMKASQLTWQDCVKCITILKTLLMERPLSLKLKDQLGKKPGGVFSFLNTLYEGKLGLFGSPFIMTRARLTYCLSVMYGIPSRLAISASRGVPSLIKDMLKIRITKKLIISPDREDSTWYEHGCHRVFTTPDPEDVWKNRTAVVKNGLSTVVINTKADLRSVKEVAAAPKPSVRRSPENKQTIAKTSSHLPIDTFLVRKTPESQSSGPFWVIDVEGEAKSPVEICIMKFDPEIGGKGGIKDRFFRQIKSNIGDSSFTHGLNKSKSRDDVDWADDMREFWVKVHGNVYCKGSRDIKDFLDNLGLSGTILDLEGIHKSWDDINKTQYACILDLESTQVCSRKDIHDKLPQKQNGDINKKHLPHCAEVDCLHLICMAMGKVPDEFIKT
uniref:Nucleoprotein n=1 Tax=Wenling frogfish arenavirus 2 TaxID=2116467 RepID=A0A2P1GNV4_9VIRU|nr:nucleoprotein [Wenling frogfish arenavirus 2]